MKIFNLSSHNLSNADTSFLSRGLNFAPLNKPSPFLLFKDLNRYVRNLTLKRYYHIKEKRIFRPILLLPHYLPRLRQMCFYLVLVQLMIWRTLLDDELLYLLTQHTATSPICHTTFKPKSTFYPSQAKGPYIESFYRVVFSNFQKLCQSSNATNTNNLSPVEIKALKLLMEADDLVIKLADKGGGIVLQDKSDYIKEARRLLSDTSTYQKINKDPISDFAKEVNTLVSMAFQNDILNKFEKSFLLKDFYQIPYFCHLPKVHKSLDNPPSRSIVAAMDSITTGLSLYIDHFLQPIVHHLQSYIRDGTHLLELLSAYKWEPTYVWLSLDVNSLYTSIPHAFGLMALEYFFAKDPLINPRQASFILEATSYCLTHNYFQFDGDFYVQIQGTAMGANFAPSYANLAMGYWENLHILHNNKPYACNIVFFGRYIDDIIIRDGPVNVINNFVNYCNDKQYGFCFLSSSPAPTRYPSLT